MFQNMMDEAKRVKEEMKKSLEKEEELVAELSQDMEVLNKDLNEATRQKEQADSELLRGRMMNQDLEASLAKLKEDMEVLQEEKAEEKKKKEAAKAEVVALNRDKTLLLLCIATAEGAKRRRVE